MPEVAHKKGNTHISEANKELEAIFKRSGYYLNWFKNN